MKLTVEELLLIRDSLLLKIRENTKLVEACLELIPDNVDDFKENSGPFLNEMKQCSDLIEKVNNALTENGSVL